VLIWVSLIFKTKGKVILSKILEELFKIDLGLQLATRALLPFLKIGTAAACFHNQGNFRVSKLRLKM
jgi:hypothetical protein